MSTTPTKDIPDASKKLCLICKDPEKALYNSSWCIDCKAQKERERRANLTEEQKEAMRQKERERYERNKANAKQKLKQIDLTSKIECSECKDEKPLSEFYMAKQKGIVRTKCKECTLKEKKEKYDEKVSVLNNQKIREDFDKSLKKYLKKTLSNVFSTYDFKKLSECIGCTRKYLSDWISYQLSDDLKLENYKKEWYIELVTSNSILDLTDEQKTEEKIKEYYHWKNFIVVKIGSKVTKKLIKEHQKKLEEYLKLEI